MFFEYLKKNKREKKFFVLIQMLVFQDQIKITLNN